MREKFLPASRNVSLPGSSPGANFSKQKKGENKMSAESKQAEREAYEELDKLMSQTKENKMKVVILRGLPGVGKSYYIKNNLSNAFICSADHYFEKDGEYKFNPSKLSEAHGQCMFNFIAALTDKLPLVVVDNTNITKIEIAPYISVAQAFGYEVEIVCISNKLSLRELSYSNIHGVPYQSLINMESRWENNFPPFWPQQKHIVH